MQVGKFSKISKHAGGNKAVQVGIFRKPIVKKIIKNGKFSKINKRVGGNKAVQVGNFQILVICAALLLDTPEYFLVITK